MIDANNNLCPGWRIARIGEVALLEKPADDRLPKRIDCYEVSERGASGTALARSGAAGLLGCAWKHKAEPPDSIARRDAGETLTDIARSYNVSHSTISRL